MIFAFVPPSLPRRLFSDISMSLFRARSLSLTRCAIAPRASPATRSTIHPWIASLYVDCDAWEVEDGCPDNPGLLKCPSAEDIAKFDQAVKQGDILWAASPMDLDAGVVGEPGFFADPMEVASNLNRR